MLAPVPACEPSTHDLPAEIAGVLDRARAAQATWGALCTDERARRIRPLADVFARRRAGIVDVVCTENGKPRVEAVFHEVVAATQLVIWACDAAPGKLAPRVERPAWMPHRRATVAHRPYGVVGVIGPWNVPFYIPTSLVLPALLAGNAVVFKPSERTPRCADMLATCIAELDLPAHLFQIVHGAGDVGAALIDARPDKLLFTGSVQTGRRVMAACARFPIPCSLELGGVDAMIVRADADLELAAAAATWGACFNGGQACCSVERLLVHSDLHDALVARIADKMRQIVPRTDLAPAIDDRQAAVWRDHVADARQRGLQIHAGGHELPGRRHAPTLITGTGIDAAACWREESFGPILAALPFRDDDEAVALHNETDYGLTASIFTGDAAAARQMAPRLRAGAVSVNEIAAMVYGAPELPWGGVGWSGFGRSHGEEGFLDVTWPQVLDEAVVPAAEPKRPWWFPYDDTQATAFDALPDALVAGPLGRARELVRTGRDVMRLLIRSPRL